MTDPQFISQLHLAGDEFQEGVGVQMAGERQQFRGHTTKNMKGNPNTLFLQDPQAAMARDGHNTKNLYSSQVEPQAKKGLAADQKATGAGKKAINAVSQMSQLEANNHAALVGRGSPYIIAATGG